jgi:glycosyltransferase involved in cell wall biosynthesis
MKTVYFVEYGSEEALRQAIWLMASNAELRKRIGSAARSYYEERHTVSAYTNSVLSTIELQLSR